MKKMTENEIDHVAGGPLGFFLGWAMERYGGNARAERFRMMTGESMFGRGNMK